MTVVTRNAAANGSRREEERLEDEGQRIQLEKGREKIERERERGYLSQNTHLCTCTGDVICTQARRGKEIDWMESWPGPFSRISSIGIPTIFIHSC